MKISLFNNLFYGTSIASCLCISFLFLSKNENNKNIVLYILCIFTTLLCYVNFISIDVSSSIGKIITLITISLCILSIILNNNLKKYKLSYLTMSLALIVTILKLNNFI